MPDPRVKLRCEDLPPELAAIQRQRKSIVRDMERAIAKHDFGLARRLSEEEKLTRENFEALRKQLSDREQVKTVTGEDIIAVIAARVSISVAAVKAALERAPEPDLYLDARNEIAGSIPVGRRDWVDGLVAYLSDCSTEDGDRLLNAIRRAKAKLG